MWYWLFCPKDFRISYNLITYTEQLELQEKMVWLIMENLECRTNWTKVVLPTVAPILLLLNLSIMAKYVSSIIQPFLTTTQSASEAVELRTISAMVDHAEANEQL